MNQFRGTCGRVKLRAVVSEPSKVLTMLVVLPGKEVKYCKPANSKFSTKVDFLPKQKYLYIRPLLVLHSKISNIFLLPSKKILLILECYGCHFLYKALYLITENSIIVAGITAHMACVATDCNFCLWASGRGFQTSWFNSSA